MRGTKPPLNILLPIPGSPTSEVEIEGKVTKVEEKKYVGIKRYAGMMLSLLGSLCFACVVLFVKLLKDDYELDSVGVTVWKYVGMTLPAIPLLVISEWRQGLTNQPSVFITIYPFFDKDNWKTSLGLLTTGVLGATSNVIRHYALEYMSAGDLIVFMHSTPVVISILAHFTLREKCGVVPIIIAFTTLVGAIIVSKPPILTGDHTSNPTHTSIGAALAFGSVIMAALGTILTRKFRVVHFAVMTLVYGVVGVAELVILYQVVGQHCIPKGLWDSILVVGVAGLSFVGMVVMILALKFEQAAVVTLVRNCDVVFGFGLQFAFFNLLPDVYSVIGTLIVLFGVGVITLRKYIEILPDGDEKKSTWSWVMK